MAVREVSAHPPLVPDSAAAADGTAVSAVVKGMSSVGRRAGLRWSFAGYAAIVKKGALRVLGVGSIRPWLLQELVALQVWLASGITGV